MLLAPMDNQNEAALPKVLSDAANRALKEAAERREAGQAKPQPPEIGGRKGQEPTRFGDWEKNGIAHDF